MWLHRGCWCRGGREARGGVSWGAAAALWASPVVLRLLVRGMLLRRRVDALGGPVGVLCGLACDGGLLGLGLAPGVSSASVR